MFEARYFCNQPKVSLPFCAHVKIPELAACCFLILQGFHVRYQLTLCRKRHSSFMICADFSQWNPANPAFSTFLQNKHYQQFCPAQPKSEKAGLTKNQPRSSVYAGGLYHYDFSLSPHPIQIHEPIQEWPIHSAFNFKISLAVLLRKYGMFSWLKQSPISLL